MQPFTVLLVNPNQMKPAVAPVALDYLADALTERGIACELLDLCWEPDWREAMASYFAHSSPGLIAFSIRNTDDCYFASQQCFLPRYREMIHHLRELTTAPIVLGGVGYSIMPEAILRYLEADVGIAGDGEGSLAELALKLRHGGDWSSVPGLVCISGGSTRRNAVVYDALESLPPRRRALIDNARYWREGGQGGFETKRGCDQHCIYCADPVSKGNQPRFRTPAQVADEIEVLLAQGVTDLHTCDCEFNLPEAHALDVCRELVARGLGERVRWWTYCSPTPFSQEIAQVIKQAGCVGVDFGADSGDDAQLRRLGRRHTAADLRQTAQHCRGAGLVFMYDLLLGGPGETRETMQTTVGLMKQIGPDRVGVSLGVRVYPDTPLAAMIKQDPETIRPHLLGQVENNSDFLWPIFFLSAELGDDPAGYLRELVAGDQRFFLPSGPEAGQDYNYNENEVLVQAIERGERGAYWDILRRLAEDGNG